MLVGLERVSYPALASGGMNHIRVLIALAILDFMFLAVWIGTSTAENCEHDRLACNELIAAVAPFAFAAGLLAFVCVAFAGVAKLVRRMASRGLRR
jgi:hypothetical protein